MHANPSQVTLRAAYGEDTMTLAIVDDGCGFKVDDVSNGHFGLVGIEERVRQLGGEVRIRSVSQGGTQIFVHLPRQRVMYQEENA
jgi:signal transduction histidine kinase